MADDNKHNKIIDVSKPRSQSPPSTSIDTSRVSAHTLKEQQSLDRLKKKVGNLNAKENRASGIKSIIAIILVILLIILAIVFIIVIGRGTTTVVEDYDMRLSMQIENKSSLSIITEAGLEQLREINPGDKVPLRASVRNSADISGEATDVGTAPPAIFVRFKIVLILDYVERYDIIIPTFNDEMWHKYNSEEENVYGGIVEDDHFYYYKGSLAFMEPAVLFSQIEFDGNVITCEDGGKYGQIQVYVECIPALITNITSRSFWPTAPQGWIEYMRDNTNLNEATNPNA